MRARRVVVVAAVAVLSSVVAGPSSGVGFGQLPAALTSKIDPAFAAAGDVFEAFVHPRPGDLRTVVGAVRQVGAPVIRVHEEAEAVYTVLSLTQVRALAARPSVVRLEANRALRYHTDSSHTATRGAEVYDATPVKDASGRVVNGHGVGVAVIDSGVDATHPDLEPRVVRNYKVLCNCPTVGYVLPLDNSDEGGGHGTHVAGTVAGTGAASGGRYAGAARGAAVYGLGAGAGLHIVNATAALQWVLENHAKVSPPIRVVNNSWGGDPGRHDPNSIIAKLSDQLVDRGVVVVWAAGNEGGDGSAIRTNPYANNPKPGNISVANYSDQDKGTRSGVLSSSSSRGVSSDPATWPDLSAPGTNIMAACRLTLPVCNAHLQPNRQYLNLYAGLSGTSMAAPHVAGIVAQLLQANPALSPAQVENVLEDAAYKFLFGAPYASDPYNTDDASSFDKGHGLVDVITALKSVCSTCSGL